MRNNDFTINQPFDESFIFLSLYLVSFFTTVVITKQIEPSIFFIPIIKKEIVLDIVRISRRYFYCFFWSCLNYYLELQLVNKIRTKTIWIEIKEIILNLHYFVKCFLILFFSSIHNPNNLIVNKSIPTRKNLQAKFKFHSSGRPLAAKFSPSEMEEKKKRKGKERKEKK